MNVRQYVRQYASSTIVEDAKAINSDNTLTAGHTQVISPIDYGDKQATKNGIHPLGHL